MGDILTKLRSVQSFCDESGRTDLGQIALEAIDELARRPKWNGSFEAARRIARDIVGDHLDNPNMLIEKIAETLLETWDDCALATEYLYQKPKFKQQLLTKLLREYGIGIATLEEVRARTTAIARGEFKPEPDEPKLWFSSIECLIKTLKNSVQEKSESMTKEDCQ